MNTNKFVKYFIILFITFFSIFINASAYTTTTKVNCNSLDEKTCSIYGKCRWISGTCQEQYVASSPCSEKSVRTVLKFFGYIIFIAKLLVPLIIIGFGTFDLFKAVIDKDEKSLGKQVKMLLMRIVVGVFVFFIPTILNALFSLSESLDIVSTDEYKACATCLLDINNCDTSQ